MIPPELQRLAKALPQLTGRDGETYRLPGGRVALQIGRVTKSIDRGRMSVQSVLTYPGRDYDGDTVNPAGGDWTPFEANPLVNWEHDTPIGRGPVPELKAFKVGGDTHLLPVGETTFFKSAADCRGLQLNRRDHAGRVVGQFSPDECAHAADSVFRLIADDIASGVSIEFRPNGPEGEAFWQSTGHKSVLLGRPEYHWERWLGEGWAHALQAKNPNASTILGTLREKAFRIAATGTFPGGEKVSPLILKAFAPFKGYKPHLHRVEKAMDETIDAPPVDAADDAAGKGMKPTPTAYMQAIQHLKDGAQMIRDLLDGGALEHEKGIAGLEDHAEELDSIAADLNAKAAKMFPDAGFESAAPKDEPDGDEYPVETTDDGAVKNKAFPSGFPVRFRVAKGGGYEQIEPRADAAGDETTLKALGDDTRELLRQLKRERRGLQKDLDLQAKNRRAAATV